ncbi:DinB family protein [Kribbella sp. NPDC056861]|uniref:DinB family protein n=1 Tax=Kribbella sp. NPDC056861 TaxID=3154857 RepID=UPI003449E248
MISDQEFRRDPATAASERELLQGFLDFHRGTLLWKTAGLTGEQLTQARIEPSTMTLLGLVRHLSEVERYWYQVCLAGRPVELKLWTDEYPDGDFDLVDPARAAEDLADLREAIRISDEIAAAHALDDTFTRPKGTTEYSVRYLYIHMIEEYARHNGHVDLLREQTDGLTGE